MRPPSCVVAAGEWPIAVTGAEAFLVRGRSADSGSRRGAPQAESRAFSTLTREFRGRGGSSGAIWGSGVSICPSSATSWAILVNYWKASYILISIYYTVQ